MARKNVTRFLLIASGVLIGIVLIIGVFFASTSSSSDAIANARAAAVEKGFNADELYVRNLKITESLGGFLGEEAYIEFAVKDSNPLQTVRIDSSRVAFQPYWKVIGIGAPLAGR